MKTQAIFQQLQLGEYFRIPGISPSCIYRKANGSHCSVNGLLQPIRPFTQVIPVNSEEITEYFATKQEFLKSISLAAHRPR